MIQMSDKTEKPQSNQEAEAENEATSAEQERQLDEAFEQLEARQRAKAQTDAEPAAAAKAKTPSSQGSKQADAETSQGSGTVIAGLALVVALISLGVGSFAVYELLRPAPQETSAQVLLQQIGEVDARVQSLQQQMASAADADLEQRLDSVASSLRQQQSDQQNLIQQSLADFQQQLDAVGTTTAKDWVYAEVEYLVRMAVQRVLMERDGESARQLLISADEIVSSTDGLTAHQLREALAQDIAALEGVSTPDTQGIYLSLSALMLQVPKLRRSLPEFEFAPVAETPVPADASIFAALSAHLSGAIRRLASLVDFRRDLEVVKPILPPKEEYFLRQNLILKLQVAQMAVLEGDQAVFESALQEAQQWTTEGFDVDDAPTQALVAKLQSLQSEQIAAELPDITGSLRAARQMLGVFGSDQHAVAVEAEES